MLHLRRPAIDLKGKRELPVASQSVQRWRQLHRDRDAPTIGVEEVEVVLTRETGGIQPSAIRAKIRNGESIKHSF